ncbi:YciI family protein [Sutcliffiella halmapala]|uniref:YciI family protein n=1 Tax=Sutcliffiella halmapala TaxID=79882 RepID=UPI0009958CBC|nr:YciI family protein [Sutcliffiella halmapala]
MQNETKQFIYVLKLIPSLLNQDNWTKKEEEIVGRHFAKLQALLKEGKLIMAGKTLGLDENTFGIVILEVEEEAAALKIMENDPAVSEGIMTAELFPYKVALIKNQS